MRMTRGLGILMGTLLLAPGHPVAVAAAEPAKALIDDPGVASAIQVYDAWVARTAADREQPGVSIAIVHDQDLVWSKGYGFADLAKKTPATPGTDYRIASLSKLFTATAILQLRDAGKLQLDDPVAKWLPEFAPAHVDANSPVITVRHLLTHTSGLPREVEGTYWNDLKFPSREEMEKLLNASGVVGPPESEYKYSNVALSLAGYVVEKASGEPYADYVTRHILQPLGMSSTYVIPARALKTLATGYGQRVPGKPRRVKAFLDAAYMVPAASLASTVEDLARFAELQFRSGTAPADSAAPAAAASGNAQILRASTLREMQRVQWLEPDWKSGSGLGWAVSRRDDQTRIGHGGAVPGHRTQITLIPAQKFGVIVLTNAADGQPGRYANAAIKIVAPAVEKAAKASAAKTEGPKPDVSAWSKYVGTYGWEDDVSLVMVIDGELCVVDPTDDDPWEGRVRLEPMTGSPDTFRMKSGSQQGELVRFTTDASGVLRMSEPGDYMLKLK
ncbi:MAG TPA: serine hydrolase domain-containing protein [Thermoanaerobaculia bacterium]|jgi:CubicO group peptidase (beta-lactamase class C family)